MGVRTHALLAAVCGRGEIRSHETASVGQGETYFEVFLRGPDEIDTTFGNYRCKHG
jgi:hypothetical protein